MIYLDPLMQKSKKKIEIKWNEGLWLGKCSESAEHLTGDSEGVHRARSVRRLPEGERYKKEIYQSFRSTPWEPKNDGRFYPEFILPDARRSDSSDLPKDSGQPPGERAHASEEA